MAHAVIWIFVALVVGIWTLMAWTADSVLNWPGWSANALAEWPLWLDSLRQEWLDDSRAWLLDAGPEIQAWLQQTPDLRGLLGFIVWTVWLIGAGMMLLMGIAGSALVKLFQPKKVADAPPPRH
jgi:hypothetical protein